MELSRYVSCFRSPLSARVRTFNICRQRMLAMAILLLPSLNQAATNLIILPTQIILTGREARQQLLVEQTCDKEFCGQFTNDVEFVSSAPEVVRIKGGAAVPVTNGAATIYVKTGKLAARAPVIVSGMEKPFDWSFRNHIQPVLARNGCSAGACHGAAAGQNGFKLSLRGYDDASDWLALTHGSLGRRIVPSDPGRSLMLLKPTGAVPHKGGKRFDVDSLDYRIISQWIADGTPGPKANDPRITRIEVLPQRVILSPGTTQQLTVRAFFDDNHSEDVTRWAKYTSANETVCQIDERGQVKVVGFGEGAVTAWYLSRIDIASIAVPFTNTIKPKIFANAKRRSFIDDLVLEKLKSLNLPPSPRCSDEEFLRRAFLDTIGTLPTASETREFLA